MIIDRVWSMPNKNTFDIPQIRSLILETQQTNELWIDPFANRNRFARITNDLNPTYDTDYHMDALEFLKMFSDNSVDGVLYDPPYSPRQIKECYESVGVAVTNETTQSSYWSRQLDEIARIVKPCGCCISFGWNSAGVGESRGFSIERILLVAHGGYHNDTICTISRKRRNASPHKLL